MEKIGHLQSFIFKLFLSKFLSFYAPPNEKHGKKKKHKNNPCTLPCPSARKSVRLGCQEGGHLARIIPVPTRLSAGSTMRFSFFFFFFSGRSGLKRGVTARREFRTKGQLVLASGTAYAYASIEQKPRCYGDCEHTRRTLMHKDTVLWWDQVGTFYKSAK